MHLHPTSYALTFLLIQSGFGLWLLAFDVYCWDVLCPSCRRTRLPGVHPLIHSWTERPARVLVGPIAEPLAITVYRTSIFCRTQQVSRNKKARPELGHNTTVGTHSPWPPTSNSTQHLAFKGSVSDGAQLEGPVSCEVFDSMVLRAWATGSGFHGGQHSGTGERVGEQTQSLPGPTQGWGDLSWGGGWGADSEIEVQGLKSAVRLFKSL